MAVYRAHSLIADRYPGANFTCDIHGHLSIAVLEFFLGLALRLVFDVEFMLTIKYVIFQVQVSDVAIFGRLVALGDEAQR